MIYIFFVLNRTWDRGQWETLSHALSSAMIQCLPDFTGQSDIHRKVSSSNSVGFPPIL